MQLVGYFSHDVYHLMYIIFENSENEKCENSENKSHLSLTRENRVHSASECTVWPLATAVCTLWPLDRLSVQWGAVRSETIILRLADFRKSILVSWYCNQEFSKFCWFQHHVWLTGRVNKSNNHWSIVQVGIRVLIPCGSLGVNYVNAWIILNKGIFLINFLKISKCCDMYHT